MTGITHRMLLMVLGLSLVLTSNVRADFLTGDPTSAMGDWVGGGNSLANGTYIRGSANLSFDAYRSATTVMAGDALNTIGWSVGDRILGMGGVLQPTAPSGWLPGTTTGALPNANLGDNVRIVSKFGASSEIFSASSAPPTMGNGRGSFSGGDAGLGGVLLGTLNGTLSSANSANAGSLQTPNDGFVWDGGVAGPNGQAFTTAQLASISRYVYLVDANGQLRSWQLALNLTGLDRELLSFPLPSEDAAFDQALQVGTGSITDALIPANAQAVAVPGPSSLVLAGMALMSVFARRSRLKKLNK